MLDHALVDPWRTTNPQLREFSWDNKTSASRIDFALVSAPLYHQISDKSYTSPSVHIDHKTFTLSISLNKFKLAVATSESKTLYNRTLNLSSKSEI